MLYYTFLGYTAQVLRPKFQSLLFSLTEQEIQNTWNVLSSKIQTFESKAYKKNVFIVHV